MSFERTITSRGKRYRQIVESRWDKEKKQSRIHVIRHIGSVVEKDGIEEVIAAESRFESIDMAYPVGNIALFWKIAESFHVKECLSDAIGEENAMAILLLAINQLMGRKALTKMSGWIKRSPLHRWISLDPEKMTKDYFLSALDSISSRIDGEEESRSMSIQHGLSETWKGIIGHEHPRYFFYQDITRIRWNGQENEIAERGYGAQTGRPHIGFGLLVSRDHYMPLAGYPVRGSNPDKVTVRETIDNLSSWKLKRITLVWDRGFVSRANIDYALEQKYHVLSGGPHTSSEVNDWISKYEDSVIEKRENIMEMPGERGIYFKDEIGTLFGHTCRIVIIIDPEKRDRTRTERDLAIQRLETETSGKIISGLKASLSPIVKPAKGRRGYEIDSSEEAKARKQDGRSLLFCTDISMPGKEIVKTYFQKDRVEKAFRYLKGDASLSPVRYQLPGRVEAYLSVVNFIAYEIMAAIMWKIDFHSMRISYEDLMDKLSAISEVVLVRKGKRIYRWTTVSQEMQKLLKPFDLMSLQT
ncbi:MAG: Transposase [Thermoplasmatales archaeon E-plasma]|nr:MAG: Transposase [Thermoplasmatales archaeon E-plasma]